MQEISSVLPPLIPEVMNYMQKNGIEPDGPAFFMYLSISENNELATETGFPVKNSEPGDGEITGGFFPAGNYAQITYTGDYKDMIEGHMALESWIETTGLKEKKKVTEAKTSWGGRTEFYLTEPDNEPDASKWITEIVFLLA